MSCRGILEVFKTVSVDFHGRFRGSRVAFLRALRGLQGFSRGYMEFPQLLRVSRGHRGVSRGSIGVSGILRGVLGGFRDSQRCSREFKEGFQGC